MRDIAIQKMEKEYKKLYDTGKIVIDADTAKMAEDIVEHSPVPLSVLGVTVEDVKGILDRVRGRA